MNICWLVKVMLGLASGAKMVWPFMLCQVGLGGGYQSSSSHSKSSNYPVWTQDLLKQLVPLGQSELDAVNNNVAGNKLTTDAGNEIESELNLSADPTKNADLQSVISSLTDQSQRNWAKISNDVAGSAQRAGGLYSTAATRAAGTAGENVQSDLQNTLAQLLYGNYQDTLNRRAGAVGPAVNMGNLAQNKLLQILNYFKGLAGRSSGTSSGWNIAGDASAKFGGAPAPA